MQAARLPMDLTVIAQLDRVGVLYGGLSAQREVSLQRGSAVITALKDAGGEVMAKAGNEGFSRGMPRVKSAAQFCWPVSRQKPNSL